MSYAVSWIVPERVLQVLPPTVATDDLVKDFDHDMVKHLDASSASIDVVVDVRHVQVHPSAQAFINLRYFKHPRLGRLIMLGITDQLVLRFIMNLSTQALHLQVVGFATPGEVEAYLKTHSA